MSCAIYLQLAFTLSATRSGVDRILARYLLIHQYGASEVGNAQNDSFLSLAQVYVYVLFSALSWWRSYCIQGMRPRYVVWKLRVLNHPNQGPCGVYPPTQGDQVSTTGALFGHWVGLILLGAHTL